MPPLLAKLEGYEMSYTEIPGNVTAPQGFKVAAGHCGVKAGDTPGSASTTIHILGNLARAFHSAGHPDASP